jgi:(p)ppGpp synthase/HD superfamily hydrolase
MTHIDEEIQLANAIAITAHAGQKYGDEPYYNHVRRVADTVMGVGQNWVAAALLHDVMEDTPVTAEHLIQAGISRDTVEILESLTRWKGETYKDYIERVRRTRQASIIKLADLNDHLRNSTTLKFGLSTRYNKAVDRIRENWGHEWWASR